MRTFTEAQCTQLSALVLKVKQTTLSRSEDELCAELLKLLSGPEHAESTYPLIAPVPPLEAKPWPKRFEREELKEAGRVAFKEQMLGRFDPVDKATTAPKQFAHGFEIGSWVRCIEGDAEGKLIVGKRYKVICKNGGFITIADEKYPHGSTGNWYPSRFRPL